MEGYTRMKTAFRAFDDDSAAYRQNFEVIGVTEGYGKVAVSLL